MLICHYYTNKFYLKCGYLGVLNNFLIRKEYRKRLSKEIFTNENFIPKRFSEKSYVFIFRILSKKRLMYNFEESRINRNLSCSRTVREMFSSRHNIIKLCPTRQLDEFVYETSCFRDEIPIRNFKHVSSVNTWAASGEIIIVERYLHRTNKIRIREVALDR